MATCKDCIHFDVCQALEENRQVEKINPKDCGCFKDKSKFVKLPCKVWDTVYVLTPKINTVFKGEVRKMLFNHKNELVICVTRNENGFFNVTGNYKLSSFGKTVFITKEEAEKALKEREQK